MNNVSITVTPASRAKVFHLERFLLQAQPVECPLKHYFADGCYVREIFMPAGAMVTGHIHKHEHIAHVSCGEFWVYDGTGRTEHIKAPMTFVSKPGIKRALWIIEDTIFLTIHRLRDPDERRIPILEDEYISRTEEDFSRYIDALPVPKIEELT